MPPDSGTQRAIGEHGAAIDALREDVHDVKAGLREIHSDIKKLRDVPCTHLVKHEAEQRGERRVLVTVASFIGAVVGYVISVIK